MDLLFLLEQLAADPEFYLPVLFAYAFLAAVLLPLPAEAGLLNPYLPWYILVLVFAAGKTLGAAFVYPLGPRIGRAVLRWVRRWPWLRPWYEWVRRQVARYSYGALFALLAVPFMTDTAPLYAFLALHPHRGRQGLRLLPFVMVNLAAAVARGLLFLAGPLLAGWS